MSGVLGFFGAGPWRGRVAQEPQRCVCAGGELETPAGWYDQGIAWGDGYRGHRLGGSAWRAAPHLAAAFQDVPDLFHSAVPDGAGDLSGGQGNVDHAGAAGAVTVVDEEANLGAVGRRGVWLQPGAAQGQPWDSGFLGHGWIGLGPRLAALAVEKVGEAFFHRESLEAVLPSFDLGHVLLLQG